DRAGVVHDADAELAQRVEDRQAERHLLERSGWNETHDGDLRQLALEARDLDTASGAADTEGAAPQRDDADLRAAAPARGGEATAMPVGLLGEDGDAHGSLAPSSESARHASRPRRAFFPSPASGGGENVL